MARAISNVRFRTWECKCVLAFRKTALGGETLYLAYAFIVLNVLGVSLWAFLSEPVYKQQTTLLLYRHLCN